MNDPSISRQSQAAVVPSLIPAHVTTDIPDAATKISPIEDIGAVNEYVAHPSRRSCQHGACRAAVRATGVTPRYRQVQNWSAATAYNAPPRRSARSNCREPSQHAVDDESVGELDPSGRRPPVRSVDGVTLWGADAASDTSARRGERSAARPPDDDLGVERGHGGETRLQR